ncbi:MAG: DnaT-like ssDNA-binding protein [[Pasteurella] mairii]|uniref:Putative DnaT-like domain-containing protein n=1 Tax=[Pasteurella] mairii TaxID=757 RepID=A0A379B477_9PAST|nr:DnaT-like ssDNA-binding protein [[Pasteurella] mairii]SUB33306.1 Uncharacterised protein [[Pasteurella] mairii]
MSLMVPEQAYVSLEEADAYHAIRASFDQWDGLDDAAKERRLVSASDFLDVNYRFSGHKAVEAQSRAFPRQDGVIPKAVKFAVCELALHADLNQNQAQKMASVKVGPVAVNYEDQRSVSRADNRFEYVKLLLTNFLDKQSVVKQVSLLRG